MKNDILFGILITLLKEGKKSYSNLADKFEISKRTVQRYCNTLEFAGVPIYSSPGKDGGVEIMGTFNLKNMFFTEQELSRILTHLHASPLVKLDNLDQQIEEKLNTQTILPNSNFLVDYSTWDEELKLNPLVTMLDNELALKKCYNITYINSNGEISTRVISPHKFILKNSKWYLFAFCHAKQQTRVFKLNRIQGLSPSSEQYVENTLSDDEIKDRLNHLFEQITITIEVSSSALGDALEWLNDYKIEYKKNGNALVTGTANHSYDLLSKLLTNYKNMKLLSPESLIAEVKQATRQLVSIYN